MHYADLHIHSKFSRATSRDCDLENLSLWAAKKGLSIISTGDFTHPTWFNEIKEKLDYLGNGTFKLKEEIEKTVFKDYPDLVPPKFLLSVEISTIYKKGDKTRKVHHVVFCPDIESASKFRNKLDSIGNINSDGRPILGLDSRNLLEIALLSNEDSYIIPAHIWTPWFSVLGSKSGFDSIEECYEDLSNHIFALETGLSSDPAMNWKVSRLDRFRLVSNSDAHSPNKLAREATIFKDNPDYFYIKNALQTGVGYIGTVEFYPEEGKYHLDGHRKCDICLTPSETKALNGICPKCHKPLTIGVSYRVQELSDRFDGSKPKTAGEVYSLVPLNEIIAETLNVGVASKKVCAEYERLIQNFGSELSILQNVDLDLIKKDSPVLAVALDRLRKGEVIKHGGFDGEYGTIKLFKDGEAQSFLNLKLGLNIEPTKKAKKKEYEPVKTAQKPLKTIKKTFTPDKYQLEAINSTDNYILITAGPGAGKTAVLTKRIARLIKEENKNAHNILAITFTKKAANELTERLKKLDIKGVNIHTFHSLCFKILKENIKEDFKIITNEEKALYKEEELDKNSLSFDDLIEKTLQLFLNNPDVLKNYQNQFKYIFVDEYQDIDLKQYQLIKLLTTNSLFAIGDANQAIYAFRGGSSKFFKSFMDDFPESKTITLKNNYRSTSAIVEASNQMIGTSETIANNKTRNNIILHKANSEKSEAEFVVSSIERLIGGRSFFSYDSNRAQGYENEQNFALSDFAVLYRSRSQLNSLKEAFNRISLPYANYSDDLLCNRKEIRDFLINLKEENIDKQVSTLDGIVENSVLEYFLKLADKTNSKNDFIHEVSFLTLADTYDKRADRISLMTLHASKGLEFKCVFVLGVEEGLLPFDYAKTLEEIEEEKRLFYVGMTRAIDTLILSYAKKRNIKGTYLERTKSRFLDSIDEKLLTCSEFISKYKPQTAKQLKLF